MKKNRISNIFENMKKRKKHSRSAGLRLFIAAVAGAAVLTAGLFSDMAKMQNVTAAGPVFKTIKFIKWTKLYEMPTNCFWGILMTEYDGEHYFTSGDGWGSVDGHGSGWFLQNININPYISNGDTFYTKDLMCAPYFYYGGKDGDNKDARKYILEMSGSSGKTNGYYLDYTGSTIQRNGSWDNTDWMTILDKRAANDKGIGGKVATGDNIIFWNTSGNDTALKCGMSEQGKVAAHGINSEGDDDWTATRWQVYAASEVEYSCLYDYTMDDDQVLRVESDVILMDGQTLTIPENSVLCVKKGNFYVNGTIKCYGTIIVEDGACIMPYLPQKKASDIDLDGGTLVIMSGGRVYAGNPKGLLTATEDALFLADNGATVINYGLLAASRVEVRNGSVVENHPSGTIWFGVGLDSPGKFGEKLNASNTNSLGLGSHVGTLNLSSDSVFRSYSESNFWYPSSTSHKIDWKVYNE